MSCICLGPKGSGKTSLLASLQRNFGATDKSTNPTDIELNASTSVATVGINLISIRIPFIQNGKTKEVWTSGNEKITKPSGTKWITIREVGGSMASMWRQYFHDIEKVMFVIDTSNLCSISAAGVLLYSLLVEPTMHHAKFLIVLTKMDSAYRQMRNEALLMLQYAKLKKQVKQNIQVAEVSSIHNTGLRDVINWLLK